MLRVRPPSATPKGDFSPETYSVVKVLSFYRVNLAPIRRIIESGQHSQCWLLYLTGQENFQR